MEMDSASLKALVESIEIWANRVETGVFDRTKCPLCVLARHTVRPGTCPNCIVFESTGYLSCDTTVFYEWEDLAIYYRVNTEKDRKRVCELAEQMLEFLISLLPDDYLTID